MSDFRDSYSALLKDPRWQKKRLEILERDGFMCQLCESTSKPLHVHHNYYLRDYLPWAYSDDAYKVFCEECHKQVTGEANKLKILSGRLSPKNLTVLVGYCVGLLCFERNESELNLEYVEEARGLASYFGLEIDVVINAIRKNSPSTPDQLASLLEAPCE